MDKRAAEQYLNQIYGTDQGYVAVAYKEPGGLTSWQECQFQWPQDKRKLIGWAEVHQDANIFICPALRKDAHTRKKGDGKFLRWLWADVDWQGVPESKRAEVVSRIKELGCLVIRSGTDDNLHVYVKLTKAVSSELFAKLNTGLRDYLYADNKQADNSLLRLPGTTNWKTEKGTPVTQDGGVGRSVSPEALMKRRVFRDAKVVTEDVVPSDWVFTEVEGLSRRIKAKLNMPVSEAMARYGNRHNAVNGMVKDLHRAGFDVDQIHSLMNKYPAGLHKMSSENGYDFHLDIDRCLARIISTETHDEDFEDEDQAITELTPEEDQKEREKKLAEAGQRIVDHRDAVRWADEQEGLQRHKSPPPDTFQSLDDALSAPAAPVQWLIEGMASADSNVIITGQYKTGKTALMVASLIPSLVDGKDFLNHFAVHVPKGGAMIHHWNLEMSRTDLVDKYMRNTGIVNRKNVSLWHGRGHTLNILTEPGKQDAINALCTDTAGNFHEGGWADVWTIDSYAQLARMAGVNTNDNDEVYNLMAAVDEIKVRANVRVCFLLGHTGRNSDEKSSSTGHLNATRGASAVDEHVDARWVLTKDGTNTRYLATEGRDVDSMSPCALDFNKETKVMTLTDKTKADVVNEGYVQVVVAVLATEVGEQGITQSDLVRKVRERVTIGVAHCKEVINEAVDAGFVEAKRMPTGRGGRAAIMHFLTGGKPEGDDSRLATPRIVDIPKRRRQI